MLRVTLYTGMYLARHRLEQLGKGRLLRHGTVMGYEQRKNEALFAIPPSYSDCDDL